MPAPSIPPTTASKPPRQAKGRILLTRFFTVCLLAFCGLSAGKFAPAGSLADHLCVFFGICLATVAMAGRMFCSLFIGGRKQSEVVQAGPYAWCRHPLYFFSFVGTLGVTLATGMFSMVVLAAICFLCYYPIVMSKEEAYLSQRHGEAWTSYAAKVSRFWPNLKVKPPQDWQANPKLFLNHLGSALVFPVAAAFIRLLPEILHAAGLQTRWTLW